MRVIVYGIGKRFFSLFSKERVIDIAFVQNGFKIVGFADKSDMVQGKEILYDGHVFKVQSLQEYVEEDFDNIVITSKVYYDEIRNELIKEGYKKEQILSVDILLEKYFDQMYHIECFDQKVGLEIGGPTIGFYNIYSKCAICDGVNFSSKTVWWENKINEYRYEDIVLGKVWIAEATDMRQIGNERYDFVLSSNNLEHIANPLKALKEFTRVVKKGGTVLIVVPSKKESFDHNRDYTKFTHLLEDYNNNVDESDLSHLPEIIEKHDYDMDVKCGGKKNFIERAKKNVENRCLHHHVFDEDSLRKSFDFVGLEVIDVAELIEGNLAIIGKKSG